MEESRFYCRYDFYFMTSHLFYYSNFFTYEVRKCNLNVNNESPKWMCLNVFKVNDNNNKCCHASAFI